MGSGGEVGSSACWELGHRSGLTEHSAGGHSPTLEYLCQIPGEPEKVLSWREGQRGTPRAVSQNSYVAAGGKVNCGGDWRGGRTGPAGASAFRLVCAVCILGGSEQGWVPIVCERVPPATTLC